MSSVAVLTQESFAEHRGGLKDIEFTGMMTVAKLGGKIFLYMIQTFSYFFVPQFIASLMAGIDN